MNAPQPRESPAFRRGEEVKTLTVDSAVPAHLLDKTAEAIGATAASTVDLSDDWPRPDDHEVSSRHAGVL